MPDSQNCPVCNGPIQEGVKECPRCGFRLAGKTEALEPLEGSKAAPTAHTEAHEGAQYSLYVSKGPQIEEEFYLDLPRITLGRDPHCDIFLNDMTVSREHSVITVTGSDIEVADNGSLNGTWVDGAVVDKAKLVPGSILQIGTFTMVLQEH